MVVVLLTNRAREYGYIIWGKQQDESVKEELGSISEVDLVLNGKEIGKKRIDWKGRRISMGYRHTRHLSEEHTKIQFCLRSGTVLDVSFV
jgi:hypothetical protein